jgi:hypothetical protein
MTFVGFVIRELTALALLLNTFWTAATKQDKLRLSNCGLAKLSGVPIRLS